MSKGIDITQFLAFNKGGTRVNWKETKSNIIAHLKTGTHTAGSIMAAIETEKRWLQKLRNAARRYGASGLRSIKRGAVLSLSGFEEKDQKNP